MWKAASVAFAVVVTACLMASAQSKPAGKASSGTATITMQPDELRKALDYRDNWIYLDSQIAEKQRGAVNENIQGALELQNLHVRTKEMKDVAICLGQMEIMASLVTDERNRVLALDELHEFYAMTLAPRINGSKGEFADAAQNSQFPAVRQYAKQLLDFTEKYESEVTAPRSKKIDAAQKVLGKP